MRLLVCGTRHWPGSWEDIAEHFPEVTYLTIIHGACSRKWPPDYIETSVDMIADFVARGIGANVHPFPVDKRLDGPWPAAGPRRNARMLRDGKPTHGLAFGPLWKEATDPKSVERRRGQMRQTGTGDMTKRMLDAGLPVRWVPGPGEPAQDLTSMPEPPVAT